MLRSAIKNGWGLYKNNFMMLAVISFFRAILPFGVFIFGSLLAIPLAFGGINIFSNPQLIGLLPSNYLGVFGFVFVLFLSILFLLLPYFVYLNQSSVILSHKNNLNFKSLFSLIKSKYQTLLVDGFIYWVILLFLVVETLFAYLILPLFGVFVTILSMYVLVRLSFWDVLALLGEQHPLRSSWNLTKGYEFYAFLFFLLFFVLKLMFPAVLLPLLIILLPFESASKLFLVIEFKRKSNKLV